MRARETPSRDDWLREGARGRSVTSGLIETAAKLGLDLYPVLSANASFLGTVSDASFNRNLDELIRQLKTASPRFDGVFLVLHGAMVAESHRHGDAEVARRVRAAMGPDFPIIVTNDFHANVAPGLVENSDVLITYVRSLRQSRFGNEGASAVIEVDGSTRDWQNLLLLTSRPSGARNVEELTSNGIDPRRQKAIVSKGTVAPYETFQHVAGEIILVNTPGPTDVNPARFTFRHLRRPLHGIDPR